MIEDPRINRLNRTAILIAKERPSLVILKILNYHITSPGVRNRLKTTVSNSRKRIAFIPLMI